MDLFASGVAIAIRHPTGSVDGANLAAELAVRLDELTVNASGTFASRVAAGLPAADEPALYVGLATEWAAELGLAAVPGWDDTVDLTIRVARRRDQFKTGAAAREAHLLARDGPLLLRGAWLLLHALGWRHFMPNGVAGLENVWRVKTTRETLSIQGDRTWIGAVDHALGSIAGGTTNLNWSDGTNHPGGLLEGDLKGALGDPPEIAAVPVASWLRHMGWTQSSRLQIGEAWAAIATFDDTLAPWDEATQSGHYVTSHPKLYTDDGAVRASTLAYAIDRATDLFAGNGRLIRAASDWVSLSRSDGDVGWDEDFADPVFGAKLPVTRQIELANHVAAASDAMSGIVIQAYGRCAEAPQGVMPDPQRVCVVVVEAYRPPGKTVEAVVADYVDDAGQARCPLGLYQYMHSAAWGPGGITAKAGSPSEVVAAVNRVRALPPSRPKVVCGEAMTEFGLYGLGYYCYMRMVLDIGRTTTPFTLADFDRHASHFYETLFPTVAVRSGVQAWYAALLDSAHKPLLSSDLVHRLWENLGSAWAACVPGSDEELRLVELAKFTRYLDLRNAFEAALAVEVAGDHALRLATEAAYDELMAWLFRTRDSGLVDTDSLFDAPLDETSHTDLGLDSVYAALNTPPGDGRGIDGTRAAWDVTLPQTAGFTDPATGWIVLGLAANPRHGLTEIAYTGVLSGPWNLGDTRPRQSAPALRPYRAQGKMHLWLVPGSDVFTCTYTMGSGDGGAFVEFVEQATGEVVATVAVETTLTADVTLETGTLYEVRLTTYATGDQLWLDWWTGSSVTHGVSVDPGRDGDPGAFSGLNERSAYFLVPDGVTEIHFYAETTATMALYLPDGAGSEVLDTSFQPRPRSFQTHPVAGTGRRVLRIAGLLVNQIGFWLLNCPNLFALTPEELLSPADA